MASVRAIENDAHFRKELASANTKLVVADFSATWCGSCQRMDPVFQQLSTQYMNAVFLKVDVDECQDTAAGQKVSVMPTFIFYRNKTALCKIQGADATALEDKVKQLYTDGGEFMDLTPFIIKAQCECLNESDAHPLVDCLESSQGFLLSDCDEQLIFSIPFNQGVKIHSLKVKAPSDIGPKLVKIFINQPMTLDFDKADSNVSVQELEIRPEDLKGNHINLQYVKFQNVQNIQMFVKNNQTGSDVTQIDHFAIFGSPIATTNMDDLKRVCCKKGESH